MNPLKVLVSNYVIDVGFLAWFAAQLLKTILAYIPSRRINWERMVGSGGMPSSHSALVCAIAVGVAKKAGYAAPEFAIAIALAAIVMYDAMGVRRGGRRGRGKTPEGIFRPYAAGGTLRCAAWHFNRRVDSGVLGFCFVFFAAASFWDGTFGKNAKLVLTAKGGKHVGGKQISGTLKSSWRFEKTQPESTGYFMLGAAQPIAADCFGKWRAFGL